MQEREGRLQGGILFRASVDVLRAPKGRLSALVSLVDGHNMVQDHPTEEWKNAYMNRQQQIANGQMAAVAPQRGRRERGSAHDNARNRPGQQRDAA